MKVKLPDSLKNAKTLSKVEKLMTTQRELVEELRLVCTPLATCKTRKCACFAHTFLGSVRTCCVKHEPVSLESVSFRKFHLYCREP